MKSTATRVPVQFYPCLKGIRDELVILEAPTNDGWRGKPIAVHTVGNGKLTRTTKCTDSYIQGDGFSTLASAAKEMIGKCDRQVTLWSETLSRSQKQIDAVKSYTKSWNSDFTTVPKLTAPSNKTFKMSVAKDACVKAGAEVYVIQTRVFGRPELAKTRTLGERILRCTVIETKKQTVILRALTVFQTNGTGIVSVEPDATDYYRDKDFAKIHSSLDDAVREIRSTYCEDWLKTAQSPTGQLALARERIDHLNKTIVALKTVTDNKQHSATLTTPAGGTYVTYIDQSHYMRAAIRGKVIATDGITITLADRHILQPGENGIEQIPLPGEKRIGVNANHPDEVYLTARAVLTEMARICRDSAEYLAKYEQLTNGLENVILQKQADMLKIWQKTPARFLPAKRYRRALSKSLAKAFAAGTYQPPINPDEAAFDAIRSGSATLETIRGITYIVSADPRVAKRARMRATKAS